MICQVQCLTGVPCFSTQCYWHIMYYANTMLRPKQCWKGAELFLNVHLKVLSIKSAILHPRIMGIIHECGGKMHMAERQWAEAATDFLKHSRTMMKLAISAVFSALSIYLVLANMLMESEVNPFDGQEAKPHRRFCVVQELFLPCRYKNDPEILAMTNLIASYQRNEILEFEIFLKSNRRTIRTQVLLKLIKPYTRIRIPFISKTGALLLDGNTLNYFGKNIPINLVNLKLLLGKYQTNQAKGSPKMEEKQS